MYKIVNKEDLLSIFDEIKEEEVANNLKPIFKEEDGLFIYLFGNSHYILLLML